MNRIFTILFAAFLFFAPFSLFPHEAEAFCAIGNSCGAGLQPGNDSCGPGFVSCVTSTGGGGGASGGGGSTGGGSGYTLLEPLPTLTTDTPNLSTYLKGVYILTIGMAGVLAVVMIIFGGIEYIFSAIPSAKADAKKRILGAIGGLLLALLAWILLNTINPVLLQPNFGLKQVGTHSGSINNNNNSGPAVTPADTGHAYCTQRTNGRNCYDVESDCYAAGNVVCEEKRGDSEFAQNEWQTRDRFDTAGISINTNSCGDTNIDGETHYCTNVYGMEESGMADNIIAFNNACTGCELEITGGTEAGRPGHGVANMHVDLKESDGVFADNDELSQFLVGKDVDDVEYGERGAKAGLVCTYTQSDSDKGDYWSCNSS